MLVKILLRLVRVERDEQDSSYDEPEEVGSSHSVSHGEAVKAFDVCIKYLEQQPNTSSVQLMLLNNLRSSAMSAFQ